MKVLGVVVAAVLVTSCASHRSSADVEFLLKAAREGPVHCWKRTSESTPLRSEVLCHESGYEEALARCLVQAQRPEWEIDSTELAPGSVLICMSKQGWDQEAIVVSLNS